MHAMSSWRCMNVCFQWRGTADKEDSNFLLLYLRQKDVSKFLDARPLLYKESAIMKYKQKGISRQNTRPWVSQRIC